MQNVRLKNGLKLIQISTTHVWMEIKDEIEIGCSNSARPLQYCDWRLDNNNSSNHRKSKKSTGMDKDQVNTMCSRYLQRVTHNISHENVYLFWNVLIVTLSRCWSPRWPKWAAIRIQSTKSQWFVVSEEETSESWVHSWKLVGDG